MDTKTLCKRFKKISSDRAVIESHWQDISRHFLPERYSTLVKQVPGQQFDTNMYDTTGMHALQIMASGIHGYLTNPSDRWFMLSVGEGYGAETDKWLNRVSQLIFDTLNQSNFSEQIHEAYLDLVSFGTASFYVQEGTGEEDVVYYARPIAEIYLLENSSGQVDTVFRKVEMTARQAKQRFGDNPGETASKALKANKPEEDIEYLHVVLPREERDTKKKDSSNMPFASVWIDHKTSEQVSEGGYREFPFMIPRYSKTTGHAYGYSPCMLALPEVRMCQEMSKTLLKAAQKLVDPPIVLPDDGYLLPFDTTPGAVNFKNASVQSDLDVLQLPHQLPIGDDMLNQRRKQIRDLLFTDLFLMLAALRDKQMTAKEVAERVSERMIILAPVLGRLTRELLKPVIERTLSILFRAGKIPEPPAELQGQETQVEFISPLAQAQKSAKVGSINEMMMIVSQMAAAIPEVIDTINGEEVVREIGAVYNLQHLLRSDKEVEEIQQMRKEAQQRQMMLEQGLEASRIGKNAAESEEKLRG